MTNPVGRFGQRFRKIQLINTVQLKAVIGVSTDAAGQDQHRNPIEERLTDTTRRMSKAGCGNNRQYTNFATMSSCRAAYPIGHEGTSAFVGNQNRLDEFTVIECVIQLGIMDTRNAKRVTNTQLF